MYSLFVLAEADRTVKASIAGNLRNRIDVCAREGRELKMIRADMSLEGLMLAEGLMARRIIRTSKSFMSFMCLFMPSEPCACQEALRTSFPITGIGSFLGMRALDVLLEMLLLEIRFVATLILANT